MIPHFTNGQNESQFLIFRNQHTSTAIWDSGFPGLTELLCLDPRPAVVDLLLIAEVVAQRAVGLLRAAQLPAAVFLIGLLASLRLDYGGSWGRRS